MVDINRLNECCDRVVELHFSNGHVVVAKLFLVNPKDDEIIYDLLRLCRWGPANSRR